MKKSAKKMSFKASGFDFLGNCEPKIKRIKVDPSHRIRQVLRFLNLIKAQGQYDEYSNTKVKSFH